MAVWEATALNLETDIHIHLKIHSRTHISVYIYVFICACVCFSEFDSFNFQKPTDQPFYKIILLYYWEGCH